MGISKRDLFSMNEREAAAGRKAWHATGQRGRFASSSFDAESMAPKTWILWADGPDLPGGKGKPVIEAELYVQGRVSDPREGVVMLIIMCPLCGCNLLVREDNKQMALDYIPYRKAPKHMRIEWAARCREVIGKPVMDDDRIPIVSSPERWACDYCHGWAVRVTDGIALTDMTGMTQLVVDQKVPMVGGR